MLMHETQGQKRQIAKRRQAEQSQNDLFAQAQEELAALDADYDEQL